MSPPRSARALLAIHSRRLALVLVGSMVFGGAGVAVGAGTTGHPMDPLTQGEIASVVETLTEAGLVGGGAFYPHVTLREPAKADVLAWSPGTEVQRLAAAVVRQGGETFEAVVDTTSRTMVSWEHIDGVQPSLLPTVEWSLAQIIVRSNPDWQAAVSSRGIADLREVVCIPNSVGHFGSAEDAARRLVKVVCYAPAGADNFWGRPIEGLIAIVDLDARELTELIDSGPVPIPEGPVDFDEASVGELRDAPSLKRLAGSGEPSFAIDGHTVAWQKWRFHYRLDARVGPVVSLVTYDDLGSERSILYQGSLSEIFIPYMDPDVGWYFRTFLDVGENGVGLLAVELRPGLDCPADAVYFDADFARDTGEPFTRTRAACMFERSAGDIAWRHSDAVSGIDESRPRTDLVLRSIAAIGNYDYIFDWVFRQDGTIKVAVGATGIPLVKAVPEAVRGGADLEAAYGHLVAPRSLAINHDHFFSFRLDLDVDGRQNSFVQDRLTTEFVDSPAGRKSVWVVDSATARSEADAQLDIDLREPSIWRIVNPGVRGVVGHPVSYQLQPGANATSLLSPGDSSQRRAGFTDHHIWVTPYQPDELYSAGDYPNQHPGGAGLPAWTSADRSIEDTDIVAWYTVGFHHVPRTEDWPVTPTVWHDFQLRPFDFFDRNPALDVPVPDGA